MAARYRYVFAIQGLNTNSPPFDMLRYDQCWPLNESAANDLASLPVRPGKGGFLAETITIFLESHRAPTPGRWASFRWDCSEPTVTRVA